VLRTLKTGEAAALLNVTPNTLRTWERRFGYPKPHRVDGKHRLYAYAEVSALREALQQGLSISSAVSVVREAYGAEAHALVAALASFRADEADEAMEGSLALRSLERSVAEVLLPALGELRRRKGSSSAAWGFAANWGNEWLRRAHRMAPAAEPQTRLLIGDACDSDMEPSAAYTRALSLCCARKGMGVLTLPVCTYHRLAEATAAFHPDLVIIAGSKASDDEVARWAYAVRAAVGRIPFLLYLRGLDPVIAGARARILPRDPIEAQSAVAGIARVRHAALATEGTTSEEETTSEALNPDPDAEEATPSVGDESSSREESAPAKGARWPVPTILQSPVPTLTMMASPRATV
jgi:MerR family transcriptional regulator, light-induced transcriptional regulator